MCHGRSNSLLNATKLCAACHLPQGRLLLMQQPLQLGQTWAWSESKLICEEVVTNNTVWLLYITCSIWKRASWCSRFDLARASSRKG